MADRVCAIKPRGYGGILHCDRPPQALTSVSSEELRGNIQHSHTDVHCSASSANKSTDYPNALELNKLCKGTNSSQRPLGMIALPQPPILLNGPGHGKLLLSAVNQTIQGVRSFRML